jgi:hypothetical protein
MSGTHDERPWERVGEVRRDLEPDRAHLLKGLALAGVACGVLGVCFLFPALVGMPLSAVAWRMANRDWDALDAGRMDPRGRRPTADAWAWAGWGLYLNCFGLTFGCLALLVLLVH